MRALGSEYLRSFLYKYESKPFGFLLASEGAISVKRNDWNVHTLSIFYWVLICNVCTSVALLAITESLELDFIYLQCRLILHSLHINKMYNNLVIFHWFSHCVLSIDLHNQKFELCLFKMIFLSTMCTRKRQCFALVYDLYA